MFELLENRRIQLAIASGIVFLGVGLAFRIARSSEVEIEILNSRLELSNKINKTSDVLSQLENIQGKLELKETQYQILQDKYNALLVASSSDSSLKELAPVIAEVSKGIDSTEVEQNIEEAKTELSELSEETLH